MIKLLNTQFRREQGLLRNRRGVALVEFAFAFPMLLILVLNGLELVHYVVVQMKVNQIAVMTADSASKLRSTMTESFMNQLFTGADKAGASIDFKGHGKIIVSSVQNNAKGTGQWVRWQRCFGSLSYASKYGSEGSGASDSKLSNFGGLAAAPGSAIIYAEAAYDYQPLFPAGLLPLSRVQRDTAFVVRQRVDFSISGSNGSSC